MITEALIFQILLIEDNPGDVRLIQELMREIPTATSELEHVPRLAAGLARLEEGSTDLILLDLSLPDSHGLNTVNRVHAEASHLPIVVLTGADDQGLGIAAVQRGAQDYLVKGQVDAQTLERAICYAVERKRLAEQLRLLSLTDDLTGLYNRRGFMTLGHQQWKLAQRTKRGFLLFYLDQDLLKQINDRFGHQCGDAALLKTAHVLKQTFRTSDILARVGGDEFAALAIDGTDGAANIVAARLRKHLDATDPHAPGYPTTFSLGIARFDPDHPVSLEELMAMADRAMYENKSKSKSSGLFSNPVPIRSE